jgi:hypothetical protein
MALLKNVASQFIPLTVLSTVTGLPVTTDDHSQLSVEIAKDNGAFVAGAGAFTERVSSAAAHIGEFLYALSQSETNANVIKFRFYSSTANYVIAPMTVLTDAYAVGVTQTGDAYAEQTNVIVPDLLTITTNQNTILANQNVIVPDLVTITNNQANQATLVQQNVILADLVTITNNQALQGTLANDNIIKADLITITNNQALQALDSTVSKPGTAQTITPPGTMATLANQNTILADLVTITNNQVNQATLANQNIIIPDLVTITNVVNSTSAILSGITSLAKWLRGMFRKDAMDSTAKTEINLGGGTFNETTDSTEALNEEIERIYNQTSVIAPSIITITNNQALQALDSTVSKPGTAQTITPPSTMATLANQLSILADLVTITNDVAGFTAPDNTNILNIYNLIKANADGDVTAMLVILNKLITMLTTSGPDYTFTVDALKNAPSGGSAPSKEDIRQEMDSYSTKLATIVADIITITNDMARDNTVSKPGTAQTITPPATMATLANQLSILSDLVTITNDMAKDNTVSKPGTAQTIIPANTSADITVQAIAAEFHSMVNLDGAYTTDALKRAPTSGGTAPTVEQIRSEIDSNSSKLSNILADIITITNDMARDNTVSKPGTAQTITPPATMATLANQLSISADIVDIVIPNDLATQSDIYALSADIGNIPTNPLLTNDSRITTIINDIDSLSADVGNIVIPDDIATQDSVNSISADVITIKDQTDLLEFTTDGDHNEVRSDMKMIDSDATAANKLSNSVSSVTIGTISNSVSSPTASTFDASDITNATVDFYKDFAVIFVTGNLAGQGKSILSYSLHTGLGRFITEAFTSAPANGDKFIVIV